VTSLESTANSEGCLPAINVREMPKHTQKKDISIRPAWRGSPMAVKIDCNQPLSRSETERGVL